MTRINVGIDPKTLSGKMLIAEHREIKRIPNAIKSGRFSLLNQPNTFTLGTGHVKFFYDKIGYLKKRYISIYNECLCRNYKVTNFIKSFENIDTKYMNDYIPTNDDIKLIKDRILERLTKINKK